MSQQALSASHSEHETKPATTRGARATASPPQGAGLVWFGGWLFTVGFAKLVWWKAVLGVVLWPYFLGESVH